MSRRRFHQSCGVPAPLSILVVVASPAERPNTGQLEVLLDILGRRPDVRVTVWLLRHYPEGPAWPDARIVDRLRTWPVARVLEGVGLQNVADRLRGLRLRLWRARVRPDAVIFDDGLGQRLFPDSVLASPDRPVLFERRASNSPLLANWEPEPVVRPDVVICSGSVAGDVEGIDTVIVSHHSKLLPEARKLGEAEKVASGRQFVGIDGLSPIVCGWGDDVWIDGAELFVRALWALEYHHGIAAHGVWFGLGNDPNAVDRLFADAERCGVADRLVIHPANDPQLRFCGDVAFLPYRERVEEDEIHRAVASGLKVVAFEVMDVVDPAVSLVPHLDVDAAAAAMVPYFECDRDESIEEARQWLDIEALGDRIVHEITSRRR